ncbi:MAG TPA: hypothetical protein VMZ69_05910 [Saprospiraceae bacterium]|nr:hypothetical protein [Saprospiraceae bacterium]
MDYELYRHQFVVDRVREAGITFVIRPIFSLNVFGEQGSIFSEDLSGNALEFKVFINIDQSFAKQWEGLLALGVTFDLPGEYFSLS